MRFLPWFSVLLFLAAGTTQAQDVMWCGTTFVEEGDTEYEVISQCGEPTVINDDDILGERWIYDQGPGTLLKILTIRNGRIHRIEDGPRQ